MPARGFFHHPARSVVVSTAGYGGVSPPAKTPGQTPGGLAGEDARATMLRLLTPKHGFQNR